MGQKYLGSREHGVKKAREQGAKEREHRKLIKGAVIKKTWGAGSRGLNIEGSGGPPMQSLILNLNTWNSSLVAEYQKEA